jgi:ferredoxin like protein
VIVDDLFDLTSFRVHREAHIRLDYERCRPCDHRACTFTCPARCYEWSQERGRVEFAYEACLECGTCLTVCDQDALEWHYPVGGFGVRFSR